MPIYRIFSIFPDYQRLRPVDADQAPREAHQLSVEENSLSKNDWSTWKGQGAPAVEPMIHQLSMGLDRVGSTSRPQF